MVINVGGKSCCSHKNGATTDPAFKTRPKKKNRLGREKKHVQPLSAELTILEFGGCVCVYVCVPSLSFLTRSDQVDDEAMPQLNCYEKQPYLSWTFVWSCFEFFFFFFFFFQKVHPQPAPGLLSLRCTVNGKPRNSSLAGGGWCGIWHLIWGKISR